MNKADRDSSFRHKIMYIAFCKFIIKDSITKFIETGHGQLGSMLMI